MAASDAAYQMAREQQLGFKPQKELVYNQYLPYAARLDDESQEQLNEIKVNLSKAVMMRDLRPGALHWAVRLTRYINLYGRKFSKEDHILFIKLFYELVTIPKLDSQLLIKFSQVLIMLLSKRELLSRDDLLLPWRPLYELYEFLFYKSEGSLGLVLLSVATNKIMKLLIRKCRIYFDSNCTEEMLEEWRPLMCPYDVVMCKAMTYFELFLPTLTKPQEHHLGFKLWLEDFMNLWEGTHNRPSWESKLIKLLTRVATDNIGYIDWTPHVPMIFTRILRSFNLPVGCIKKIKCGSGTFTNPIAERLIVAMMAKNQVCQNHLSDLFKALESYFHPSNVGEWLAHIWAFLSKLPEIFVKRLERERCAENEWMQPIPESDKLSDKQIEEFVECMLPCVMLAMFSKIGTQGVVIALRNLSILCPRKTIPAILERLYTALENLTEPHRLTATLHCIIAVGPTLIKGGPEFPQGPTHVIPLLKLVLPGIDPNDFKKCMVTFQFLTTFIVMIQVVDCSEAVSCRTDLTEVEKEVCLSTVHFEDFVLEYMDRCFQLIENSVLEDPTHLGHQKDSMNTEEGMLDVGLSSTFGSILGQCSPAIFKSALRKLKNFITGRVLETKVSGKFACNLVKAAMKTNPEESLQVFLPLACKTIMALVSNNQVLHEETIDDELMFNILLLSEVLQCEGHYMVQYKQQIMQVLSVIVQLYCRQGNKLAALCLRHLLSRLCCIYPIYSHLHTANHQKPLTEYLPIRDWGKYINLKELNMKWHIPNDDEIEFGSQIIDELLVPILKQLQGFSDRKVALSREVLQRYLNMINSGLVGAASLLPLWDEQPTTLLQSSVPIFAKPPLQSPDDKALKTSLGTNFRLEVANTMNKLSAFILANCEDDTKSLTAIVNIFLSVMFAWGTNEQIYAKRCKGLRFLKDAMRNKFLGKKVSLQILLMDRVLIQHQRRSLESTYYPFSSTCRNITSTLLNLATSHYSEVRIKAQAALSETFCMFPYSQTLFLDSILQFLSKDPTVAHEQFKGALYVLLGGKEKSMLINYRWQVLSQLWPAIVKLKHSEKPSIIKLLNKVMDCINKKLTTSSINIQVSEPSLRMAELLWTEARPLPNGTIPGLEQIQSGLDQCQQTSQNNMRLYEGLVENIAELMDNNNLHWRYFDMATQMLISLIRYDVQLPAKAVDMLFNLLIHDSLKIRKLAIDACGTILKQQNPKYRLVSVDPMSITSSYPSKLPVATHQRPMFGHRKDNLWMLYDSTNVPDTADKFSKCLFVHKTHWGFFTWPKDFKVFSQDQDYYDPKVAPLPQAVQLIYDKFTNKQFVDKFIGFLCLEERKGRDKFDAKRFYLLKSLFRNFHDAFLAYFKNVLNDLSPSVSESKQRCGAEIIAAVIRGSKHWKFDKMEALRCYIVPVIKSALNSITTETLSDWGTCMATALESRDPNKYYWLIEVLMDDPLRDGSDEGSFLASSRMYVMLSGLGQQEWRIPEVQHRLLNYIMPHLSHSYKSIRDRVASMLTNTFLYDTNMKSCTTTLSPLKKDFITNVLPNLQILNHNGIKNGIPEEDAMETDEDVTDHIVANHFEDDQRNQGKRLLKTVCQWLVAMISKSPFSATTEIFQFLPLLCYNESDSTDDELVRLCRITIALMGQSLLLPDNVHVALQTIQKVLTSKSWRSRNSIITYLQVMVFYNFFTIKQNPQWVELILDLICQQLRDEQIEVRESAAVTLSGLLHCKFFQVSDKLILKFKKMCGGKLKKNASCEELIERHAGVLGLCACVSAHPYDVPQYIPDILMLISDHLHDPQPILTTVKKSLSDFKRTHLDSWRDHKLKFSDDQLVVLTDLLVSPSYYA